MARLDVSGSFIVTVGYGAGPVAWVVVCVSDENGKPYPLSIPTDPNNGPVQIFIALSAILGPTKIDLRITDTAPQGVGYYWFAVEPPADVGGNLAGMGVSSLGIIVNDGSSHGQGLGCACAPATVATWYATRMQKPQFKLKQERRR